jgi:hypothetical protein
VTTAFSVIAARDAITCIALGERSSDQRPVIAVELLRRVDTTLATVLKRAVDRTTQADYESTDISRADAARCVRWARQLVEAAEPRVHA